MRVENSDTTILYRSMGNISDSVTYRIIEKKPAQHSNHLVVFIDLSFIPALTYFIGGRIHCAPANTPKSRLLCTHTHPSIVNSVIVSGVHTT